jgi:hypothetical protein
MKLVMVWIKTGFNGLVFLSGRFGLVVKGLRSLLGWFSWG